MEDQQQWGFLSPWCDVLTGRISYKWPRRQEEVWNMKRRRLEVWAPTRQDSVEGSREFLFLTEQQFLNHLQKFREALAIFAAVAHVNQKAFKLLLKRCGVNLGEEGEEGLEEEIPARFSIFIKEKNDRKSHNFECLETVATDLVWLCGVKQRTEASAEYLRDLEKIAALSAKLQEEKVGVDIKVPIELMCPNAVASARVKTFVDVHEADKVIRQQWEKYDKSDKKREVAAGSLRCTLVLQPMAADLGGYELTADFAKTMDTLIRDNVWFSQTASWLLPEPKVRGSERARRSTKGQLMACFFDSTRRSRELASESYGFDDGEPQTHQLGIVHILCVSALQRRDFDAMFSAIPLTQTTEKLSIRMQIVPIEDEVTTEHCVVGLG